MALVLALGLFIVFRVIGPPPAAVAPPSPTVAKFSRGEITLEEVRREIRSLPPGLKFRSSAFVKELTATLVARRALAEEARAAGLQADGTTALAERTLVRALLEKEGFHTPRDHAEAKEHMTRFKELTARAVDGPVEYDVDLLARVVVDEIEPVDPPERAPSSPPEPFFLESPVFEETCDGVIFADHLWCFGFCDWGDDFPGALASDDVLWLESTYGPLEGFLHRFASDGHRRRVVMVSYGTRETHKAMGTPMPDDFRSRYEATLARVEVKGDVVRWAAREWFDRAADAFAHRQAEVHWNNRHPEREGTLVVRLWLAYGRVTRGVVERRGLTEPEPVRGTMRESGYDPSDCPHPLLVYRLAGTGEVEYTVRVTVR